MKPLPNHKIIIEDSVYEIPQRLKEYDESFFVVFDKLTGKFEIHSTDNLWNTYCFTVPYNTLDQRTIDIAMKNDLQKKGAKAFLKELEEEENKIQKSKERDIKNQAESMSKEMYPYFKKDIDYHSL